MKRRIEIRWLSNTEWELPVLFKATVEEIESAGDIPHELAEQTIRVLQIHQMNGDLDWVLDMITDLKHQAKRTPPLGVGEQLPPKCSKTISNHTGATGLYHWREGYRWAYSSTDHGHPFSRLSEIDHTEIREEYPTLKHQEVSWTLVGSILHPSRDIAVSTAFSSASAIDGGNRPQTAIDG